MAEQLVHELDGLLKLEGELVRKVDAAAADTGAFAQLEQYVRDVVRDRIVGATDVALPDIPVLKDALRAAMPSGVSPAGWSRRAGLGPAQIGLQAPAAVATVDGRPDTFVVGLVPRFQGDVELSGPGLAGKGTLSVAPERLAGSLGVHLGLLQVLGFATVRAPRGEPVSLLVLLSARPVPAIQLSFGFALRAVGGVVGVNRGIDTQRLRSRLSDGTAVRALFPEDAARDAPMLLAALDEFFPARNGSHVIGPTVTVTWLDIGDVGAIVRADLAVLLQLPDVKAVVVGRAAVDLPPALALRLDVLGEIDPARRLVAFDAVFVDSRALGIFRVTGTGALRLCWGNPPYVVVAAGGFYPGFDPAPAVVPPQQRLGLVLDSPIASFLSLRSESYLAITSNSFQVGGRFETGIDLKIISAHGDIALDAIVTFDPFHIHADYRSGFRVRLGIFSGGTTVSGWLDGPGPWTLHASVSIDLVLDDLTWSDTFRFGPSGDAAKPPTTLAEVIGRELGRLSHLHAANGQDTAVALAPVAGRLPDGTALVSPLGHLRWAQAVVPLALQVTRAGGRALTGAQSIDVAAKPDGWVKTGPAYKDWFAPGTFQDLTASEACQLPPFQQLKSGFDLDGFPADHGDVSPADDTFLEFWRRPGQPLAARLPGTFLRHAAGIQELIAAQGAAPTVTNRSPIVSMTEEQWTVLPVSGAEERERADSAVHALVAAHGGGVALAAADEAVHVAGI